MNKFINTLKILRGLESDELFLATAELTCNNCEIADNDFISAVFSANAEEGIYPYFENLILYNENPFSIACSKGEPSQRLVMAFTRDLKAIFNMLKSLQSSEDFALGDDNILFNRNLPDETTQNLKRFYRKNGYGKFAKFKAFVYRNGEIVPVLHPSEIQLEDLKDYVEEKKAIVNNVSDFIEGLPYSHTLLYGDRGTGKSSTVHAVLNKFSDKGLRLIEVSKEELGDIKKIREIVSDFPLKFIIFTDDLTFNENDPDISALKAAVEGSVVGGGNSMIVATSNRRHIVSESFSARENSLHPSDLKEEQLSLSDRFGLTVIFSTTDKAAYLSIVSQLAQKFRLTIPQDKLESLAERWAIVKGGRSPRRAEQFINLAYACQISGRELEF
ncbi:MAG: ATP-binding protein [Candidatus Coproplasma sp.]